MKRAHSPGKLEGGEQVAIQCKNLSEQSGALIPPTVLFGETPATQVTISGTTGMLVAITPPATRVGKVGVTVRDGDEREATKPDAFTYGTAEDKKAECRKRKADEAGAFIEQVGSFLDQIDHVDE